MISSSSVVEILFVGEEIHEHYRRTNFDRILTIRLDDFIIKSKKKNVKLIVEQFIELYPRYRNHRNEIYHIACQIMQTHKEESIEKTVEDALKPFFKRNKKKNVDEILEGFTKKYPKYKLKIVSLMPNPIGRDAGREVIIIKNLDKKKINAAREYALKIAEDTQVFIEKNTTVTVERTVCRLLGIDGVDNVGVPYPNIIVDQISRNGNLGLGVSNYLASTIKYTNLSLEDIKLKVAANELDITESPLLGKEEVISILQPYIDESLLKINNNKSKREGYFKKYGEKERGIKRLTLHAASLTIIHPHTKKKMTFETKIPDYFKSLVR